MHLHSGTQHAASVCFLSLLGNGLACTDSHAREGVGLAFGDLSQDVFVSEHLDRQPEAISPCPGELRCHPHWVWAGFFRGPGRGIAAKRAPLGCPLHLLSGVARSINAMGQDSTWVEQRRAYPGPSTPTTLSEHLRQEFRKALSSLGLDEPEITSISLLPVFGSPGICPPSAREPCCPCPHHPGWGLLLGTSSRSCF